jgi:hypothetical protein
MFYFEEAKKVKIETRSAVYDSDDSSSNYIERREIFSEISGSSSLNIF